MEYNLSIISMSGAISEVKWNSASHPCSHAMTSLFLKSTVNPPLQVLSMSSIKISCSRGGLVEVQSALLTFSLISVTDTVFYCL